MNRPEAHKLYSELLNARDRDQHLEFFQEHIEDLCDAASLAVADIDPDETDWFGKVRWCNDDIVDALQYKLINPTDENVARVRDQLEHHGFRDMQVEAGWDYIYSTIDNLELDEAEPLITYRVYFNGNDVTEVDAECEDEAVELAKVVAKESGVGFELDEVECLGVLV